MTENLKDRIARARSALALDPMGSLSGQIPGPAASVPQDALSRWIPFADFLLIADGGRFGSIDLWSGSEFEGKQYPAVDFPGGHERWLIIGQIIYRPIALEADTESVRWFSSDRLEDEFDLGKFDNFLEEVVLGPRYADVVTDGEQDEWWTMLQKAGLR